MTDNNVASNAQGLRILMVAPQPFFRPRGTPFSILHRIRALLAAGHMVDLITYPFGEDITMPGLRVVRCRRPAGIKDVRIGPSPGKLVLDMPLYAATRHRLRRHAYDVLHSHEEAAFFSVRLARRHKLIHVYDMHSSLPQQLANFSAYNLKPIQKAFSRLERYVLASCQGVITICPELASVAEPYGQNKPHAMIENTADDAQVFGGWGEAPPLLYGLQEKTVILYTGTLEAYQGIDLLLHAFAQLHDDYPRAHLLLAGGTPSQIKDYQEMAQGLGLSGSVTLAGGVHPAHIQQFLEAADMVVSPRCRGTNTPLKIYGYLRSGRPIVATDLPTHTQVLDSSVAELVPPTVAGIRTGMRRLLAEPDHRARLAAAASARATATYSDGHYLERVAEFYRQVIEANAGGLAAPHPGRAGITPEPPQPSTRGGQ